MDAPVKDLEKIRDLLALGKEQMARKAYEEAKASFLEAVGLDEHDPRACDALAGLFHERGENALAGQWKSQADQIRKDNWKKQVEAEIRGHHEMLGEPGRHEIP